MLSNLYTPLIAFFITVSSFLSAVDYEIHDIGTMQTHSSKAIAINNQGQILGWYNIDGSKEGKHFFVRDQDGSFHEVPSKENGVEIEWRYLTNDGNAYGIFDGNANFAVLYGWDQKDGLVNLGDLPGKEIAKINDAGQVLIKSVVENENGKSTRRPVIWHNGKITKLHGLEGNLGIESDEAYGYDMNNNGDVVGQSVVYLNYKNNIYKQSHATKWVNGRVIDLNKNIPWNPINSDAIAVNDLGEVLVSSASGRFLITNLGEMVSMGSLKKIKNSGFAYNDSEIVKIISWAYNGIHMSVNSKEEYSLGHIVNTVRSDRDPIWYGCNQIISVNDNGEAIVSGTTIYGEEHAMLLVPVKAD